MHNLHIATFKRLFLSVEAERERHNLIPSEIETRDRKDLLAGNETDYHVLLPISRVAYF